MDTPTLFPVKVVTVGPRARHRSERIDLWHWRSQGIDLELLHGRDASASTAPSWMTLVLFDAQDEPYREALPRIVPRLRGLTEGPLVVGIRALSRLARPPAALLLSMARALDACVVDLPDGPTAFAAQLAAILGPLAIPGLVGVDAADVRETFPARTAGLLHAWFPRPEPQPLVVPRDLARDLASDTLVGAMVTCEVAPSTSLFRVNDLANALTRAAPRADLRFGVLQTRPERDGERVLVTTVHRAAC